MMLLMNILLLTVGLWAVWIGLKTCEQVHGIALALTGLIVVIWGLTLAPLWLQIIVELILVSLGQVFYRMYARELFISGRSDTKRA